MRPLLVLGLDGATLDVVGPLVAAGRMPHLAALLGEGAGHRLPSTRPPMTFPAWSSFLTGLSPGHHGMFDFTQKVPGAYRVRFINATDRAGASLFERVGRAGGRVLALGMPATFPPERVPGLLVSGFDAPVSTGTDARAASDPGLYREVAAKVGPWMRPDLDEGARADGWHERAVAVLLDRIERKTAFTLEALARLRARGEPPDLVCVVFSESDTVQHHFWRDHDPASPRHDPGASAVRRGAVARVHERLDAACAEISAAFQPQAACAVVSDHGFGGASRRVLHLNRYLETCGLLRRTPTRRGGLATVARTARDGALRWLSPGQAQALFRRARPAAARLESAVRFAGTDWRRTVAFSEDVNTQPGVWLNLAGREAEGSVAASDHERVRREVIEALLDWKLPGGGRVVAQALPREEVYEGPYTERAPDVVVELALERGYAHTLVPTPWGESSPALRTLSDDELAGGRGRGMNGTHRLQGLFGAAAGFERLRDRDASIADVAPALLAAMDVGWQDGPAGERPHRAYGAVEEERVRARLRALGYLE
jgi:predicted AlkP superfamily phosphohydrolase/phosphomutase